MDIFRPHPPEHLGKLDGTGEFPWVLVPAPGLGRRIEETILADNGPLHSPDHALFQDTRKLFRQEIAAPR